MRKIEKIIKFIGIALMTFALLANPFVIGYLFSQDKKIETLSTIGGIIIFECLILLLSIAFYFKPNYLIKKRKEITLSIASVIFCLVVLDITLGLLIYFPNITGNMPQNLKNIFISINKEKRDIIQFNSNCSQYDSGLFYTLKPGKCVFSNIGFVNEYSINSLGVRDDEDSLDKPDIIVLGDSYAMGWCVNQNETFAQIIEKKSGLKVLNTGVSSYETVRELIMLERADLSNLKYIIIQYYNNDYSPNKEYYKNNNSINISSEEDYNKIVVENFNRNKGWFIGKNLLVAYKSFAWKKENYNNASDYFINALSHTTNLNLSKYKIIVISDDPDFSNSLVKETKNSNNKDFIKNLKIVDMPQKLNKTYLCILDNHWNKYGHDLVAKKTINYIEEFEDKENIANHNISCDDCVILEPN